MIVIYGKFGGLCNRMFTFANLIAFSEEHGVPIVNPEFAEFSSYFEGFADDPLCHYPVRKAGCRVGKRIRSLEADFVRQAARLLRRLRPSWWTNSGEQGVLDLAHAENASVALLIRSPLSILTGFYFIDHPAFVKHAEKIRAVFRPVGEFRNQVDDSLREARKNADVVIGAHIRQGDYKTFVDGLRYYSTTEYVEVLRRLPSLFSGRRIRFLLCSDQGQEMSLFDGLPVIPGPGHFVADLYALAACDYIIGPPSTFTQWASFYGRVPRFMINWKCEDHYGCPRTTIELGNFAVHEKGFGKH